MTKVQEHESLCNCGSGRLYEECCAPDTLASVIYFNGRRRTELRHQLNVALSELSAYAKRYFYGWEAAARQKFFSTFRHPVRDYRWEGIFQHWFVVNYRFHDDVSPLLDFYLAEHEDKLLADYLPIFSALKESFLSVYQVLWIHDETFALRDVFSQKECVMAREQGSYEGDLEPGSLLLARIANLGNVSLLVGPGVLFPASSRAYLKEELHFLRVNYGLTSLASFLREHADLLCGLVLDMTCGGLDAGIKTRCFSTLGMERREIIPDLLERAGFSREESEGDWLKFRRFDGRGFNRVALGKGHCVVAASRLIDLYEIGHVLDKGCQSEHQGLKPRWLEGCPFPGGEQLVREMDKERILEEWLTRPREDLEGMTPLQASCSRKGRNLLNYLLEKESTVRYSTNLPEGYQQADLLKQRLGLKQKGFRRNQKTVESLVRQYRTSQELSPYPRDYVWMDRASKRLALQAFDRYHRSSMEKYKLAWILFLWNEYSFIYRPRVIGYRAWLAALEVVFMELVGSQSSPLRQWKNFGGSLLLQERNSRRLRRHLLRHPLDLEKRIRVYPAWQQMSAAEQITAYRQVLKEVKQFSLQPHPCWQDDKNDTYSQFVYPASGVVNIMEGKVQETLGRYFDEYYCLDHCGANPGSLINLFWEEQASRYPSYLRTACFNMMMSFVGAYRVTRGKNGRMILVDIFTDKQLWIYSTDELHLPAGNILLTRLLPAGNRVWAAGPVLSLEGSQEQLLEKYLAELMEDLTGKDDSDFRFLKERGLRLVRAFLMVREEQDRRANALLHRPLRLDWLVTEETDMRVIREVLAADVHYLMACNPENDSFLLLDQTGGNTLLGYLTAREEGLFLVSLLGDQQVFLQAVANLFRSAGVIPSAGPWSGNHSMYRALERILLEDLARCLSQNRKLSMSLGFPGRQGDITDGEALVAKLNSTIQSNVSDVRLDPWNEEMI